MVTRQTLNRIAPYGLLAGTPVCLGQTGTREVGFERAVMVGMERSHHPIPPAEMGGVIAAEELMMLIVMSDADER